MTKQPRTMPGRARDERGVTGLETAIILIAFVVVASVFAFTVLSTGVFSAERGKETVYAGLKEAQASLSHAGSLNAIRGDVEGTNAIVKVKFVVTSAISGEEIDLTPPNTTDSTAPDPDANPGAPTVMIISYSDENQAIGDTDWTVDFIGKTNGDFILDPDEQAEVTVWLHDYDGTDYNLGTAANNMYLTTRLGISTEFRVEVKPHEGSVLVLERTTPARLQPIIELNYRVPPRPRRLSTSAGSNKERTGHFQACPLFVRPCCGVILLAQESPKAWNAS